MYPKAYIFSIESMPHIHQKLRKKYTANVRITPRSKYLKHHIDVDQMIKISKYDHPQSEFSNVLVVPNVDKSQLFFEFIKKTHEAFYIIESEDDLKVLKEIVNDIEQIGPDLSCIDTQTTNMFDALFTVEQLAVNVHEIYHQIIHDKFVKPISKI